MQISTWVSAQKQAGDQTDLQLHGALDTLFIRGRRMQISTWVSAQKQAGDQTDLLEGSD